jgi:hypothetical protein
MPEGVDGGIVEGFLAPESARMAGGCDGIARVGTGGGADTRLPLMCGVCGAELATRAGFGALDTRAGGREDLAREDGGTLPPLWTLGRLDAGVEGEDEVRRAGLGMVWGNVAVRTGGGRRAADG